jgi:hypothetical protein
VFWPVSSTWILFGGMNGTHTFKDAWSTLDFMNWNEVLPESSANAPAARSHFGMAVVDAAEGGTNVGAGVGGGEYGIDGRRSVT